MAPTRSIPNQEVEAQKTYLLFTVLHADESTPWAFETAMHRGARPALSFCSKVKQKCGIRSLWIRSLTNIKELRFPKVFADTLVGTHQQRARDHG